MNLEARKISLIQEFINIDNENIISALEKFFQKNKAENFEQSLQPMSVQQLNQEIDKALDDELNNRIISAKDLQQKIQKWG